MTKAVLKTKLRKAIDQVDDEKTLEAVYDFINSHLHVDDVALSEEDKALLDERMTRHEAGLDKSYSWKEAKDIVKNRKRFR